MTARLFSLIAPGKDDIVNAVLTGEGNNPVGRKRVDASNLIHGIDNERTVACRGWLVPEDASPDTGRLKELRQLVQELGLPRARFRV